MVEIIDIFGFALIQTVLLVGIWITLLFRSTVTAETWRLITVGIALILFQNISRLAATVFLSFFLPNQFASYDPYFLIFQILGLVGIISVLIGLIIIIMRTLNNRRAPRQPPESG